MPRHTDEITNSQDMIDTRDVRNRIAYLESNIEDATDADPPEEPDADEVEELASLKKLAAQFEGYDHGGETMISESYFARYAEDQARETSETDFNQWPYNCINWDEAAEQLQADYTQVDFDGTAYYLPA